MDTSFAPELTFQRAWLEVGDLTPDVVRTAVVVQSRQGGKRGAFLGQVTAHQGPPDQPAGDGLDQVKPPLPPERQDEVPARLEVVRLLVGVMFHRWAPSARRSTCGSHRSKVLRRRLRTQPRAGRPDTTRPGTRESHYAPAADLGSPPPGSESRRW